MKRLGLFLLGVLVWGQVWGISAQESGLSQQERVYLKALNTAYKDLLATGSFEAEYEQSTTQTVSNFGQNISQAIAISGAVKTHTTAAGFTDFALEAQTIIDSEGVPGASFQYSTESVEVGGVGYGQVFDTSDTLAGVFPEGWIILEDDIISQDILTTTSVMNTLILDISEAQVDAVDKIASDLFVEGASHGFEVTFTLETLVESWFVTPEVLSALGVNILDDLAGSTFSANVFLSGDGLPIYTEYEVSIPRISIQGVEINNQLTILQIEYSGFGEVAEISAPEMD